MTALSAAGLAHSFWTIFRASFGYAVLLTILFWNLDWLLGGPAEIAGRGLFPPRGAVDTQLWLQFALQLAIAPSVLLVVYLAGRWGIPLAERIVARARSKKLAIGFVLLVLFALVSVLHELWRAFFHTVLGPSVYLAAFDDVFVALLPMLVPMAGVLGLRAGLGDWRDKPIGKAFQRTFAALTAMTGGSLLGMVAAVVALPALIDAALLEGVVPAVVLVYVPLAYALAISAVAVGYHVALLLAQRTAAAPARAPNVSDADAGDGIASRRRRLVGAVVICLCLIPTGVAATAGTLVLAAEAVDLLHGPGTLRWMPYWQALANSPGEHRFAALLLLTVPAMIGVASLRRVVRLAVEAWTPSPHPGKPA